MEYPFKILHALDVGLRQQIASMGNYLWVNNDVVEYFRTLVMNSSPTEGIQIGNESDGYDYGWRDITGQITVPGVPATDPTWTQIGATVFYAWKFALTNYVHIDFHVPHDYVPGTDVYLHCHWFSDGSDTTNTVKWQWDITFSRGFGQEAFNVASPDTETAEQVSAGQYYHMVTETSAITLSALEVDSIIYVRLQRIANGATDSTDGIFVLTSDVHYQSHNLATKNKTPNFYSGQDFQVLDADGNVFAVSLDVLSSDSTSYRVTYLVLNSSGTSYDCG